MRSSKPLWSEKRPQISHENMVGKIDTDHTFDIEGLVSLGALYDISSNGAWFEKGRMSARVFSNGTIIVYGAHSREEMWDAISWVLGILGAEGRMEDMNVFLVGSKARLPFTISKDLMPAILERLDGDYVVAYDPNLPFPGIWLNHGEDTVHRIMARIYTSGVITCEASTEQIVEDTIRELYAMVLEVKNLP